MSNEIFLRRTKQLRPLAVGFFVMIVGSVLTFGPMTGAFRPARAETYLSLVIAGIIVTLGSLTWLCLRITCPRCGAKILWWAISRPDNAGWLNTLERSDCPSCSYAPDVPRDN
jgi:hypothetical protein